jgi:fructose-bisphosphate aldolase class II
MIVTTAQLFRHAYGKYAVGAYNINNAEQAMGLFRGCIQSQAPFIIQISKGARKYTDKRMLEAIIRSAGDIFPEAIFAVHLDHGDEETCYECINSGFFSSVMIDASHEPYDKNVEISKRVVVAAHAKGISVEAELGMLGGVEEDIKVEDGHARPVVTASPPPSAPATAPTNSRAGSPSTSTCCARSSAGCRAFPSSCTARLRSRRTK